jgi:hypothetical protein
MALYMKFVAANALAGTLAGLGSHMYLGEMHRDDVSPDQQLPKQSAGACIASSIGSAAMGGSFGVICGATLYAPLVMGYVIANTVSGVVEG